MPQAFVSLANLSLFVRVTDLVFETGASFALTRSFNMDDTHVGPFGKSWSFNLGDSLAAQSDGSLVLRRGSGRVDRFAPVGAGGTLIALTGTTDTLSVTADGYTLREASGGTRTFGAGGRLLAIRTSAGGVITLEYSAAGTIASARYRGRKLDFTFDGQRIAAISDSAGRAVNYRYDAEGRLTGHTNADGLEVAYEYDGSGNLISIQHPGGVASVSYAGDTDYAFVAAITMPGGGLRQYDVPIQPLQTRVRDGNGNATLYTSTASGLAQSITDATGVTISYSYDAAGRRTRTVNGMGEVSTFTYDGAGNLAGITNNAGNRWTAEYTSGRLTRVTDPNGSATAFQYDASGTLVSAVGRSAARNAGGQITALTDPAGNKTTYEYEADGLLKTVTDALGGKWTYEYDGAARAVSRTDPGGGALRAVYGAGARITGLAAGEASAGVGITSSRRLASYTDDFGNRITYAYDGAGLLSSMTLPGDRTVTYQYDRAHRLSRVSDWVGNFAIYRYDAAGFPVSATVSGGPVTIYQHDAAHRLRAVVTTGPDGAPLAGYRYTMDGAGNRTSVTALEASAAPAAAADITFAFDALNRPIDSADGSTYRYDARGNLLSIEGPRRVAVGYDPFGRLERFESDTATVSGYDTSGLRVTRTSRGITRRFVYDVAGKQPRAVVETDDANTPLNWYVYGLGLLWRVVADGTTYFYHFDGDGNVVAMSNPARGVVNTYRYDPAGRLAAASEAVENLFRTRGEVGWVDDGNGLVYDGAGFRLPELRLALPASADPAPPAPVLAPRFAGAGACFVEGVANCAFASGRGGR